MTRPGIGSVCTGYGGLDLAIEAVLPDAELRWCADYEPPTAKIPRPVQGPARVIARRFPGVPNLGDITAASWPDTAPVDIVAGGTPCQDVSQAGSRRGMKVGTRSGIWSSMVKAIEHHRPTLVVWENVGGALSAGADSDMGQCPICVGDTGKSHLRALGRVVGDLSEIGYDAVWTVVSAADIGGCHRRERVWVFAWPAENPHGATRDQRGIAAPGQAASGGPRADVGRSDRAGTAADAEDDRRARAGGARLGRAGSANHDRDASDPESSGPQGDIARNAEPEVTGPRRDRGTAAADPQGDGRREGWPESEAQLGRPHAAERGSGPAADADGQRREPVESGVRAGQSDVAGGGRVDWGDFGPAIRRWESVLGRPAPAPTNTTGKGGQALSAGFVEWMMGLPAGWVTDPDLWHGLTPAAARNAQLKLLGNGVVPQQAEAALRWGLALAPEWVRARLGYTLAS